MPRILSATISKCKKTSPTCSESRRPCSVGTPKNNSAASNVIRFGHAECAALKLERLPNKKRPHEARCHWQAVHAGEEIVGFATQSRLIGPVPIRPYFGAFVLKQFVDL